MREHAKLQNTALIIEVKPYVIHSVIISILFEHKHIVRFEIKLNREELGELLANFDDPFIRKERRGYSPIGYFFSSGFVLSSSNLYFDSTLYAMNTIREIIRKSMIVEMRSPYLN